MPITFRRAIALAHGWNLITSSALLLVGLLLGVLLPRAVPLPEALALGRISAPAAVISSLCVAVGALAALREPETQLRLTAPRIIRHVNLARVWIIAALGTVLMYALEPNPHLTRGALVAVLVGEGLLFASIAGQALAWMLPTAHVLAVMSLGAVNRYEPATWAWIIRPEWPSWAFLYTAVVAAASTARRAGS